MSLTSFFERLGAPLANSRWSWGAQRPHDGAVFLRVWQDEKFVAEGVLHMLIDRDPVGDARLGHQERRRHSELIRAGARCFLVMCTAVDVDASRRKIASFNEDEVFIGVQIVEKDGSIWIQVKGRSPVSEVIR